MESLLHDLRYGLRGLRRSPAFFIIALVTLAIGIGANTAMFSVLNAVLLRPLPYSDPARIVTLQQSNPAIAGLEVTGVSPLEYLDYRARLHQFSAVGGVIVDDKNLTGGSEPQRIKIGRITPSIFEVLGVQPFLGRAFRDDEDHFGGPAIAILSYSLWHEHFGADPGIVGRVVRLDNVPHTVIGVMPGSFKFPYDGTPFYEAAGIWVPMDFTPGDMRNRTDGADVQAFARMNPGVTLAQAQQDADAARASLQAEHPDVYSGKYRPIARVVPIKEMAVGSVRPLVLVLFGAVGFVLLIACANVGNLLLVRATVREREISIRTALGASAFRLARQLITESVLLATLGGIAGIAVAYGAIRVVAHAAASKLPRLADVGIDPLVLLFALGVSVITGVLFGLVPALRVTGVDLHAALKASSRQGGATGGHRWSNALVVAETSATIVLLLGAGLLINSFVRLLRVPPGFDPNNVLIARTAFDASTYPTAAARNAAKQRLLDQLATLPGVDQVGATSQLPLVDERSIGVQVEGEAQNEFHMISNELVSPNYFRAMGISLLHGRSFTAEDRPDTPAIVVVSEAFARKFWPDQDPIGKRLTWGGRWNFSVVGVVADVRLSALDAPPPPTLYMSMLQTEGGYSARTIFAIRTKSDPRALVPDVRRTIWSIDPNLPVYDVATMTGVVSDSLAQRRFVLFVLAAFASIALVLAAVGLYGVLSYSVAQRTREMGLRLALGATPASVRLLVLRAGLSVVGIGIAIGFAGGLLATRLIATMLFGISSVDPATYVGVGALLLVVALFASYVPARRATQVDPMIALRAE